LIDKFNKYTQDTGGTMVAFAEKDLL